MFHRPVTNPILLILTMPTKTIVMKKLLLLAGLLFLIHNIHAQELKPIEIGKHYTQDGVRLRLNTIKTIVKPSLAATQEVKRGKSFRTMSYIMGGLSAFALIGSAAAVGEETTPASSGWNPTPGQGIAVGIGGLGFATVLYIVGNKKIHKGVVTYNSYVEANTSQSKVSFDFGLAEHGVGLTVTF